MHTAILLTAALSLTGADAIRNPIGQHKHAAKHERQLVRPAAHAESLVKRQSQSSQYLTAATQKYVVNGTGIPEVNFDIGESYAGTISVDGNSSNQNALYFWFFPSSNPLASNEITIWLNGGPGCSSLDGLLQENGPFLWQPGTYAPQPNPFSWTNLTNMVYVDQPVGTGFSTYSPGTPANITNEQQVAAYFAGFWKNFMTTFNMTGRKVYITGESYAGQYIPYIADYMLNQNDTRYYNVKGIQINDPSIANDDVLIEAPAVQALNTYANVFNLNDTFMQSINDRANQCNYTAFMKEALTFPPTGQLQTPINSSAPGCDVYDDIITAAIYVNPCFNLYHLTDYCPFLWTVMGFPSLGIGPNNYFNRSDVQKAINAPPTDYSVCGDPDLGLRTQGDDSVPSSYDPLPRVIERTNNVLIGNGNYDYLIFTNGTLAAINNMTWNGKQGFSNYPADPFFVPYNNDLGLVVYETTYQPDDPVQVGLVGGGGVLGLTHSERGLTFCTVNGAGHEIPQYVPGAAYRQLEFLLGRISNLTVQGDFTTQTGNFTGTTPPSPYYTEIAAVRH